MAQIGTIKLQSQNNGVVDVPVFETGDSASGIYEFVRVQTDTAVGFIPVTNTNDATYPYLRVQTQNNGIVAVTDTAGSAIPDSGLLHQWTISEGSGTTVADSEGDNSLSATDDDWEADSDWFDGYAYIGDGTDNELTGSSVPEITLNGTYAIAMQIRFDDVSSGDGAMVAGQSSSDRMGIGVDNSVLMAGHYNGSGWEDQSTFDASGIQSSIISLIYNYDNGSGTLYVEDSAAADSEPWEGINAKTGLTLVSGDGESYLNGGLGYASVYDQTLDSDARSQFHSAMPHS